MAYVTPIGADPAQIDYRLGQDHGCVNDTQFGYHIDNHEGQLRWIGNGLEEFSIQPGTVLSEADFDKARALMNGQNPHTKQELVAAKQAVPADAKVPLAPLVAAVQAEANRRGIAPAELYAGKKRRANYQRAERLVASGGAAAVMRADEAGQLADSAGIASTSIWEEQQFRTAYQNLWEIQWNEQPDGTKREQIQPRRTIVGNRGYDVTFTLPKSYSLLLAFSQSEKVAQQVERIYQNNVTTTFDWLETQTAYGMRGKHGEGKQANTVTTSGYLGWSMLHRAARPVPGHTVGDPHWHVHITLANMAKGADGQWGTVAAGGRDLMRHTPAADKILQSLTRHELTREVGVQFARNPRTQLWEVDGITDEAIRAFSKRGNDIEAMLTDLGFDQETASSRAKKLAGDLTRQAKNEHTVADSDATLRARWQAEATQHGLDPAQITHAATSVPKQVTLDTPTVAELVTILTDPNEGVTAHKRRFTRVDAIAMVADSLPAGAATIEKIAELTDTVLADAGIVPLDAQHVAPPAARRSLGAQHMSNASRFTTRDVLDSEHVILTAVDQQLPEPVAITDQRVMVTAQNAVEAGQGFPLSTEQRAAYQKIVTSNQRVDTIIGPPGTGKTTLMRTIRAAYEADGKVVAGAATAAVAAHNLSTETGIHSSTVAQWIHRFDHGQSLAGIDVLVLDEANLTDDRDRARLYQAAEGAGTKIIEVGDPKQLRGVGCGSMFGRLTELTDAAHLAHNRRQADEDERAIITEYRQGNHLNALASWGERGQLIASQESSESITTMVAEWMTQRQGAPDPHTEMAGLVMLAGTNQQVERLNQAAQAVRAAQGEIGELHHYDQGKNTTLAVAAGDHVMIRVNDRGERLHQGIDILNGYRGIITGINDDKSVTVQWHHHTPDGPSLQTARLSEQYVSQGGIDLAYAMTTHKAEGQTINTTWQHNGNTYGGTVLVDATGMDNPALHVATTRHTQNMTIFAAHDQLADLHEYLPDDADTDIYADTLQKLAERVQSTEHTTNDTPVHDDLEKTPTPRSPTHEVDNLDTPSAPTRTDEAIWDELKQEQSAETTLGDDEEAILTNPEPVLDDGKDREPVENQPVDDPILE